MKHPVDRTCVALMLSGRRMAGEATSHWSNATWRGRAALPAAPSRTSEATPAGALTSRDMDNCLIENDFQGPKGVGQGNCRSLDERRRSGWRIKDGPAEDAG